MGNDINKIWSFKSGPAGVKRAAHTEVWVLVTRGERNQSHEDMLENKSTCLVN